MNTFKNEKATQYLVIGAGGFGLGKNKTAAIVHWFDNARPYNYAFTDGYPIAEIFETDESIEVNGAGHFKADVLEEIGSVKYRENLEDFFKSMLYLSNIVGIWADVFTDDELEAGHYDDAIVSLDDLTSMNECVANELEKALKAAE